MAEKLEYVPIHLNWFSVFREKEDDKLLNKSSVSGLMGQKYGEPSGSSAQQLALGADQSTSVTSSNKDLSVTLSKADKYHKQIPVIMKIQSTLIISKSKGPSETLRDIGTVNCRYLKVEGTL